MSSGIKSERSKTGASRSSLRQWAPGYLGVIAMTVMVLLVAVAFAIASAELGGRPGRFPFAVGVLTIAFSLLELARLAMAVRSAREVSDVRAEALDDGPQSSRSDKAGVVLWFVLTIAGFLLTGVLVTSFLSGVAYFRWIDMRSSFGALTAGSCLALGIWVVFDLLAGFTLYSGVLW
jgi:hypothetical protein